MRELGDQWIEIIDGKEHMVKAVAPIELCKGCLFNCNQGGCCWKGFDDCQMGSFFIIKDLGPVNTIGLPLCPFCKGYPELESEENWEGKDIWFVECDECGARTAEYLEAEEAVDAWKRRS